MKKARQWPPATRARSIFGGSGDSRSIDLPLLLITIRLFPTSEQTPAWWGGLFAQRCWSGASMTSSREKLVDIKWPREFLSILWWWGISIETGLCTWDWFRLSGRLKTYRRINWCMKLCLNCMIASGACASLMPYLLYLSTYFLMCNCAMTSNTIT